MKMLMFDFRDSERIFFSDKTFNDIELTFRKEPLNEFTELDNVFYQDTDILSVFINSVLSKNVLNKFKNLRIILTRSSGYNHIDIEYCRQNNIAVYNVAGYGENSVAQFTVGLIISLVRNILPAAFDMKKNKINYQKYEGLNLENMTLGIVGCGAIGSSVAKIMNCFGTNIIATSIDKKEDVSSFVKYAQFEELLRKSDIISLHLAYTDNLYHMISDKEFEKMKNGAYLLNLARGELIDSISLYKNILSGKIRGAALDVLECESLSFNNENILNNLLSTNNSCVEKAFISQKLSALDNVILTPHIAYNTQESVMFILSETFNNISKYVQGDRSGRIV